MTAKLFEQVKIMNKSLKKINMMEYMVFLKDGPHRQLIKIEKIKYKKKKEKKPKEEALVILGQWTSGGEKSSSNDESTKRFTTCINKGASSFNICLMA